MRYMQRLPSVLMSSFVVSSSLLWASMTFNWLHAGEMMVVLSLLLAVLLFITAFISSVVYAIGHFASFWNTSYAFLLAAILLGLGLLKAPSSYQAIPTLLTSLLFGCIAFFVFPRMLYRFAPISFLLSTLILGQYGSGKSQFILLPLLAGLAVSLTIYHRRKNAFP